MIQRIQTLYLALVVAALALFLTSSLPTASGSDWQAYLIFGSGLAALALALVALMKFKQRERQRTFVTAALAVQLVFSAMTYGSLYFSNNLHVQDGGDLDVTRITFLLLPVAAYLFTRLALLGINRDIKIVRSANRLR